MGIEYYVRDEKNQRLFCLGKGPWRFNTPTERLINEQAYCPREMLTETLRDAWNSPGSNTDQSSVVGDHIHQMAEKLWRFCQEAEWRVVYDSDCSDLPEWPTVCSRYTGERIDPDPLGGTGWAWLDPPKESPC
jgi:hypothetical protein